VGFSSDRAPVPGPPFATAKSATARDSAQAIFHASCVPPLRRSNVGGQRSVGKTRLRRKPQTDDRFSEMVRKKCCVSCRTNTDTRETAKITGASATGASQQEWRWQSFRVMPSEAKHLKA